ncbi:MAG TPA: hypothetical protein VNO70_09175 [Blastocatellia bacterium]|nr:hypothetical protein [Blastocatellia bacterium]
MQKRLRLLPFCVLPFAFCLLTSCGKVGAPVPPARLTERTSDLTAIQRGGAVLLAWPAPALGRDPSSRFYIARADIYRLVEQRDAEPALDPEEYEEAAELIGYLDRAALEEQIKENGRIEYVDAVNLAQAADLATTRLRYAVRYANARGQTAAFSNTVAVEPVAAVAAPPSGLRVTDQKQDAVTLAWTPPEANVDGARPAAIVGYNVYRRAAKREVARRPLNAEPLTEPTFTDRDFKYGADYVYTARALSPGTTGLIESADSKPLAFTPVDRFAPTPPDPVSVASAGGVISLFWPSSPERDVIGYNIYRAESADGEWVKLNDQPATPVTYRDDRVEIGRRYFYRVTAVDSFKNESQPSRVVSETANP